MSLTSLMSFFICYENKYHVAVDLYEHDILREDELKDISFNYIESHSNSYRNKDKDDFEL